VVGFVFVIPRGNGMVVNASFLKGFESELNCGSICDRVAACGGDTANNAHAFPQVFEWSVGAPLFGKMSVVELEIRGVQLSIVFSEMGKDVGDTDVSVANSIVFKVLIVNWLDSRYNLLF
jgi:hypothetical protein